jgi:hypothetical protein
MGDGSTFGLDTGVQTSGLLISVCADIWLCWYLSVLTSDCWHLVVLISGFTDIWFCWYLPMLTSGFADMWLCWHLAVLISVCADIWLCWHLVVLTSDCADIWFCWYVTVPTSGFAEIWLCWHLVVLCLLTQFVIQFPWQLTQVILWRHAQTKLYLNDEKPGIVASDSCDNWRVSHSVSNSHNSVTNCTVEYASARELSDVLALCLLSWTVWPWYRVFSPYQLANG